MSSFLALLHQLSPVFLTAPQDVVWQEILPLLGLTSPLSRPPEQWLVSGAEGEPSSLGVDMAVDLLYTFLDWGAMRRLWTALLVGVPMLPLAAGGPAVGAQLALQQQATPLPGQSAAGGGTNTLAGAWPASGVSAATTPSGAATAAATGAAMGALLSPTANNNAALVLNAPTRSSAAGAPPEAGGHVSARDRRPLPPVGATAPPATTGFAARAHHSSSGGGAPPAGGLPPRPPPVRVTGTSGGGAGPGSGGTSPSSSHPHHPHGTGLSAPSSTHPQLSPLGMGVGSSSLGGPLSPLRLVPGSGITVLPSPLALAAAVDAVKQEGAQGVTVLQLGQAGGAAGGGGGGGGGGGSHEQAHTAMEVVPAAADKPDNSSHGNAATHDSPRPATAVTPPAPPKALLLTPPPAGYAPSVNGSSGGAGLAQQRPTPTLIAAPPVPLPPGASALPLLDLSAPASHGGNGSGGGNGAGLLGSPAALPLSLVVTLPALQLGDPPSNGGAATAPAAGEMMGSIGVNPSGGSSGVVMPHPGAVLSPTGGLLHMQAVGGPSAAMGALQLNLTAGAGGMNATGGGGGGGGGSSGATTVLRTGVASVLPAPAVAPALPTSAHGSPSIPLPQAAGAADVLPAANNNNNNALPQPAPAAEEPFGSALGAALQQQVHVGDVLQEQRAAGMTVADTAAAPHGSTTQQVPVLQL